MGKPTLKDVAREAGVGVATVERVMNARGAVAPGTAARVVLAARKLDYDHRLPEVHRGAVRIEVILVRPETPFFLRLNRAFERIAATLDHSFAIHRTFVAENDSAAMVHAIEAPPFPRAGLVICAQDHPDVASALAACRTSGLALVQIVTRCHDALSPYVGIDNYAAGRTAAYLLSGMLGDRDGSILATCHGRAYRGHRERVRGFSDYLEERGKGLLFREVLFGGDDDLAIVDLLGDALSRDGPVIGLYTASGGDRGVAGLLGRQRGRTVWVAHELTDEKRAHLKSGALSFVLDQQPEIQARRAVDIILHRLGLLDVEVSATPVPFLTLTPENA